MKENHDSAGLSGPSAQEGSAPNDPALFAGVATEVLRQGQNLRFKATGSSMAPFIRDGDVLTVTPVDPDVLRKGDVAFYLGTGGRPIAHRVLSRKDEDGQLVLVTRGDSVVGTRERVESGDVLGRVVSLERGGRVRPVDSRLVRWMAQVWGCLPAPGRRALRTLAILAGWRPT